MSFFSVLLSFSFPYKISFIFAAVGISLKDYTVSISRFKVTQSKDISKVVIQNTRPLGYSIQEVKTL